MKKFKKILAGVLAGAMAIGMMSMSAFATDMDISTSDAAITVSGGQVTYNLVEAGFTSADQVNGQVFKFTFTCEDISAGFGGGVMWNSGVNGWQQDNDKWSWGNENQPNNAVDNGDGTYTLSVTIADAAYTDDDFSGAEGTWANITIQQWWGNTACVVTSAQVGDGAATEEEPAEVGDTTTGVADYSFLWIALAAAAATVAGTTVVLKKREEM